MKHLLLPLAILLSANTLLAQENLPPVLKADSAHFRKDILTRTYMTPKRILWSSSPTSVQTARTPL